MLTHWFRRALVVVVAGLSLVVAGCSSSTIESALKPTRIISFGDGLSDVGSNAGARYTVNNGAVNIWAQQVAASYGLTLTATLTGYARGNARVNANPGAAGTDTLTIAQQIDAFLATDAFGANDVVLINGGISDIIVNTARFTDATLSIPFGGTITSAQMTANVKQAGTDLATQVRRVVNKGAKHVLVTGAYNLGHTPWATAIGQTTLLSDASNAFNDALLVAINDLGTNVLYVDLTYYYNLVTASPSSYALTDVTTPVCTSVDAGAGIGIGTGKVNSALCTTATLVVSADYTKYFYADAVYPTPAAHTLFGGYAYTKLQARW